MSLLIVRFLFAVVGVLILCTLAVDPRRTYISENAIGHSRPNFNIG